MKILLFTPSFHCFAELSPEQMTEQFLSDLKGQGGHFLHVPKEYSALIAGKTSDSAIETMFREIEGLS